MKKYVKPELFFEQFELSTHIADCEFEYTTNTLQSMEACSAYPDPSFNNGLDPTQTIFTVDGICEATYYCYTAGVEGVNTFKS